MTGLINTNLFLDTAVELTEQDDQLTLKRTLVDGIQRLFTSSEVLLYEVNTDRLAFRSALDSYSTFERLEEDGMLMEAIKRRQAISSASRDNDGWHFVVPIKTIGALSEVVVINSPTVDEAIFDNVASLINVYRNYMLLLHKYERDALTGLLNRHSFDGKIKEFISTAVKKEMRQEERKFNENASYLAVLDIDHFKLVNDTFGHLYGDDVLILFSKIMTETFPLDVALYRFGGEEFVVIMRGTFDMVWERVEAFRKTVEHYHFPQVGKVMCSIGFTEISANCISSEIIDRADQALYYAKENGRNQTHFFEKLVKDGDITVEETEIKGGDVDLF